MNSDLVLGANGPLKDTHVAVHISKTYSKEDIPQETIYYLLAWNSFVEGLVCVIMRPGTIPTNIEQVF